MFAWRYLDRRRTVTGGSDAFADREAAEAWLGEHWAHLADQGVREVELCDLDRDEPLYRMSLLAG